MALRAHVEGRCACVRLSEHAVGGVEERIVYVRDVVKALDCCVHHAIGHYDTSRVSNVGGVWQVWHGVLEWCVVLGRYACMCVTGYM